MPNGASRHAMRTNDSQNCYQNAVNVRRASSVNCCPSARNVPDSQKTSPFNGTLRAECLDAHWFTTLAEAKQIIEAWRQEYNESRPHRAHGERTPNEIAKEFAARREFLDNQTAGDSLYA